LKLHVNFDASRSIQGDVLVFHLLL